MKNQRQHVRIRFIIGLVILYITAVDLPGASDDYFLKALDAIEASLVNPEDTYGFVLKDQYEFKALGITAQEKYSFYLESGKVHSRVEKFKELGENTQPYLCNLTVRYEAGQEGATKSSDFINGKHTLGLNIKNRDYTIGKEDPYYHYSKEEDNRRRPFKQPFQIIVNPCFAPLGITPIRLRQGDVIRLEDVDGLPVYQVNLTEGDDLIKVKMYFSPVQQDQLVKTDYERIRTDKEGKALSSIREVRTVENWTSLKDGRIVPAIYTMERYDNGTAKTLLRREVSSVAIGDVDDVLFDPDRLPEFQRTWDAIRDFSSTFYTPIEASDLPDLDDGSGTASMNRAEVSQPIPKMRAESDPQAKPLPSTEEVNSVLKEPESIGRKMPAMYIYLGIAITSGGILAFGIWRRNRSRRS